MRGAHSFIASTRLRRQTVVLSFKRCSMTRAAVAIVVAVVFVAVGAKCAQAQPTSLWVDVGPQPEEEDEVEKRYTPELVEELQSAKDDALLLYTEYTSRAGADLKIFLRTITGMTNETVGALSGDMRNAPKSCRSTFEQRVMKIQHDAHRAAAFSAENHHKFFLGHMIVFRMHLNKSEDYIKKSDRVIKGCGIPCETTPRIRRLRRLASEEIHRVRDDLQHSRRSYRDLLLHEHKKLVSLRRRAREAARIAVDQLRKCIQEGG